MKLVTGVYPDWYGSYGPIDVIYQPSASDTGTEPWNYRYVMYYDVTDGGREFTGLAYSSNGVHWTRYPSLVLQGSTSYAWDCSDDAYGTVYRDANGYHFWYSGGGGGSGDCVDHPVHEGIGYASSSDGKSWTKDSGNPIFHISDGVGYRDDRMYTPAVVDDGSGILRMYYSAQGSEPKKIGLAVTVSAGGPYSGYEGSPISLNGMPNEPGGGTLTYSWTYAPVSGVDAGATCAFSNANIEDPTITCSDDGTYKAMLTVSDGVAPDASADTYVIVANLPPVLSIVTPTDGSLYAVNTALSLSAPFTEAGSNDSHLCIINWDDETVLDNAGVVAPATGSGTCTKTHTFTGAGVYTIQVTVTDDDDGSATKPVMVVVYDPSAGFVTGGGSVLSPAEADLANPGASGPASFGFVSKYQKGKTAPDGNLEFQFKAGTLNFKSTSMEWLVVTGEPRAQFRGEGTINGTTVCKFEVDAWDASLEPADVDAFGIKIFACPGGDRYNLPATALTQGSIIIHKK